ncbi:signal recognition particle, SRP9/SRP14 subunit [Pyrenochaeta sp. DS3sAY3a]|nr:signal recognition particle, SRP9/SRP14 subunit [Pyrenochaeta sp. DS3sAY3a]
MARDHLSNDEFFAKLANLFEHTRTKGHGTVYLTQKRLTFDTASTPPTPTKVADDPLWDTHPEQPLPILIRASNNKSDKRPGTDRKDTQKIKLSTVVQPDDLDAFYARYSEACKAGMSGLKKRDKKKAKKVKKKKKGAAAETKV